MMTIKRKRHSEESKAKVALEALKGLKTVNELAAGYGCIQHRSASGSVSSADGGEGDLREPAPQGGAAPRGLPGVALRGDRAAEDGTRLGKKNCRPGLRGSAGGESLGHRERSPPATPRPRV